MYYQQGDVIIEKIIEIPKSAKIDTSEKKVLAEGEMTGHCHQVITKDVCNADMFYEENGRLYLKAKNEITIVHEEHNPIKIIKGDYEIRRVNEYDHFLEETRIVLD